MPENYPSASEIVRNIANITRPFALLMQEEKFRVIKFEHPGWEGYEIWVINERGFLWEPCLGEDEALAYLGTDEAKEYNRVTRTGFSASADKRGTDPAN